MRRRVGNVRRQHHRIEHQHGAGDAGHAAGHHQEQFAARELCEIRLDEQRRFHHAEKDVRRSRQPDRAADLQRPLEHPREAAHDRRQDAPVEQQRRQHAHDEDQRQRLERQHEIRAGGFHIEGQGTAADIAEHERRARACRVGDRADAVIDERERFCGVGNLQQHDGRDQGHEQADDRLLPRHRRALLADRKRDRQQRKNSKRRLKLQHAPPSSSSTKAGARRWPGQARP